MILVDTLVWIEHLRAGSERLKALLLDEQVLCHPLLSVSWHAAHCKNVPRF